MEWQWGGVCIERSGGAFVCHPRTATRVRMGDARRGETPLRTNGTVGYRDRAAPAGARADHVGRDLHGALTARVGCPLGSSPPLEVYLHTAPPCEGCRPPSPPRRSGGAPLDRRPPSQPGWGGGAPLDHRQPSPPRWGSGAPLDQPQPSPPRWGGGVLPERRPCSPGRRGGGAPPTRRPQIPPRSGTGL